MRADEFFKCFYQAKPHYSHIKGIKSKHGLVVFFIGDHETLNFASDTFSRFFSGARKIKHQDWDTIINNFDENALVGKLSEKLLDLEQLARNFNLTLCTGEEPDKSQLAKSIAKLFQAIATGKGSTEDTLKTYYYGVQAFSKYTVAALKKYESLKTIFYCFEERLLSDFFVCSTLEYVPEAPQNSRKIDNADLQKLLDISRYTILFGPNGIGKSMMMRHLFLESIKTHKQTNLIPILAPANGFKDSLFKLIMDNLNRFDDSLTEAQLDNSLKLGRCQILLDGLDEIYSDALCNFLSQLDELIDRYPNNQYVLSTREVSYFRQLNRFKYVKVLPFSKNQSLALVDRLCLCDGALKKEFCAHLGNRSRKQLIERPLLLTLMLKKFKNTPGLSDKEFYLYKDAYDTLAYGHDSNKLGCKRKFRSADDYDQFTEMLREFCAKSYPRRDYDFDCIKFDQYFEALCTKDNSKSLRPTSEAFRFDCVHSVGVMREEAEKYYFLNRSFQEYFFVDYYLKQNSEELNNLGKILSKTHKNGFDDHHGFQMLLELSRERVEKFVFLPYLKTIFKGTDRDYVNFLESGYHSFSFRVLNEEVLNTPKMQIDYSQQNLNPPSTVLMHFIVENSKIKPCRKRTTISNLKAVTFMKPFMLLYAVRLGNQRPFFLFPVDHSLENNQDAFLIGNEYKADFKAIFSGADEYASLKELLYEEDEPLRQQFYGVKEYYSKLIEKYQEG